MTSNTTEYNYVQGFVPHQHLVFQLTATASCWKLLIVAIKWKSLDLNTKLKIIPPHEESSSSKSKLKTHDQTLWPQSVSKLHRPSYRSLSTKLVPTFVARGYCMVSVIDPYSCILGFIDRSHYCFFKVVLTRLSEPRSRPTTSKKIWLCWELNPDLWICSHKLWPLDHRSSPKSKIGRQNRLTSVTLFMILKKTKHCTS
jgi:hypothetical protein